MPVPLIFIRKSIPSHLIIRLVYLFLLLFCISLTGICQKQISISAPRLKMVNDNLSISYDIVGSTTKDKFNVNVEITQSDGSKLEAQSLSGDIGDSINGGKKKQIVWNLRADNIYLNNSIYVEIVANKLIPPAIALTINLPDPMEPLDKPPKKIEITTTEQEPLKHKELADNPESKEDFSVKKNKVEDREESIPNTPSIKMGNFLLKSSVFPGWGLSSVTQKKSYLVIGIASVGCIASSIYYNNSAYNNYRKYLDATDERKRDLYDTAVQHENISKVCAISAASIWIANIGFAYFKGRKLSKSYGNRKTALNIGASFKPDINTPILSMQITF